MPETPLPEAMPGTSPPPLPGRFMLTVALILGTFMQMLDATIINVALPHMRGSMSAAQDQITWVLTSYVVVAGICTPLTGYLVTRFGRKTLFVASAVCFTIASMLCGVAQSLGEIVIFRMLQGASGAFLTPLSQTIIMDIYPKEKHTSALGAWSASLLLAPILGPTLGSYLTEMYSWRWAFFINLPIGIVSIIGAVMFLPESKRDPNVKFDLLGFGLIGIALGALQLMLDRGTTLDWFSSKEIIFEAVLAALAFYLFVIHILTADHPFLNRLMFKDTNFVVGVVTLFLIMFVMFGNVAIVPTMLQSLMGYPVLTTGMLVLPRGAGAFISTLLVARFPHLDARVLILTGLGITALSLLQMSRFTIDVSGQEIMVTGFCQGLGSGLVFSPLVMAAFSTIEARFRAEGTSIFSLVRNIGVAIGVSMDATLLAQNTQLNHAELVSNITPFNRALQFLAPSLTAETAQGAVALETVIDQQAGMIAYNNLFRLSAFLLIGAGLVVPLMRIRKRTTPDEAVAVEM